MTQERNEEMFWTKEEVDQIQNNAYTLGFNTGRSLVMLKILCDVHKDEPTILEELKFLRVLVGEKFEEDNK